jgi:hypothetical protein
MSIKLNSALGGSVTLNEPSTASAFTLTLPTDNIQPGMNLITPTSVVGGTFNGGAISFSAATTLSINGCFTSSYANYRIMFDATLASGSTGLNMRMRSAGSDNSTSNYAHQYMDAGSTSVTGARATAQTSMAVGAATTGIGWNAMDLFSPNLAAPTLFLSYIANAVTSPSLTLYAGGHNVSSAFDGFSIIPPSSNITGTLRIYGLRNQ